VPRYTIELNNIRTRLLFAVSCKSMLDTRYWGLGTNTNELATDQKLPSTRENRDGRSIVGKRACRKRGPTALANFAGKVAISYFEIQRKLSAFAGVELGSSVPAPL
jgi:hypothetical protein